MGLFLISLGLSFVTFKLFIKWIEKLEGSNGFISWVNTTGLSGPLTGDSGPGLVDVCNNGNPMMLLIK